MTGAFERAIQLAASPEAGRFRLRRSSGAKSVSAFFSDTVKTRGNASWYRLAAAGPIHHCHA
jgi:hypothetical protein